MESERTGTRNLIRAAHARSNGPWPSTPNRYRARRRRPERRWFMAGVRPILVLGPLILQLGRPTQCHKCDKGGERHTSAGDGPRKSIHGERRIHGGALSTASNCPHPARFPGPEGSRPHSLSPGRSPRSGIRVPATVQSSCPRGGGDDELTARGLRRREGC